MESKVGKFKSFKQKVSPKRDLGFRETRQCVKLFRSFRDLALPKKDWGLLTC